MDFSLNMIVNSMRFEKEKNQILSCDESLNHSQTRNKNNPNKNGKMNTVVLPKS